MRPKRMVVTYAGFIAATVGLFWVTPSGFIPAQDQGYFLTVIQLPPGSRSEEHTSELQSLMRISYAVFCLKKKKKHIEYSIYRYHHKQNDEKMNTTRAHTIHIHHQSQHN